MRLVPDLSPQRPKFDPRPFHVRFVVDKVALGRVFLRVPHFPPLCIIPSYMLFIQEGQMVRWWEPSKSNAVMEIGEHWVEKYIHLLFVYVKN